MGAGARGEPRQSVWYGEGHAAPPALPAGVRFWWGGGRRGSLIPVPCRSPRPDPPPGRQHGGGDNTAPACPLARSHIKSNSFIFFTFIHPSRAGEGWLGTRGAPRRTSLAGGRRLSGEVRWWRTLCQGVPYLVLGAPAQEFSLLVRAGQGVAAAVAPHVQCGVHGVREVGGLQARGCSWGSDTGLWGLGTFRPPPFQHPAQQAWSPHRQPPSLSWKPLPCPPCPPCQGLARSPRPAGPLHHRAPRLHTSCRWDSRSPRSWPRWSYAGAGSP